ncbi:response regulator [Dyadobacter tibetensis]|uniref:response regulator n=1 Tax=Dyadobacter tibetensis TaxID=1211851 RepID=UPI00046E73A5|nr:response regulator [Dyadobacter tibetensis]
MNFSATPKNEGSKSTWPQEIEDQTRRGDRLLAFGYMISYPLISILYLLEEIPDLTTILGLQLLCSALIGVLIYFHFRGHLRATVLSLASSLLVIFFHSIKMALFSEQSFAELNMYLFFALIFTILIVKWTLFQAIINTVLTIILINGSIWVHDHSDYGLFIREGGIFFFIAQIMFPFIVHFRRQYESNRQYYLQTLQRKNDELNRQISIAQEATAAKSDFLSMMSHEIRTPLNGIVGIIHILEEQGMKNQAQQEMLTTLQYSSDHLMAVVNDILDFNKINSNHVILNPKPFKLYDFLNELKKFVQPKIDEKKLNLIYAIPPDLPSVLMGDSVRLNQILTNLVFNAIKFTEAGFVKLLVEEKDRGADYILLHFEINDSGIGIPEPDQATIFDIFTQAHNDTNKTNRGSGLGLAITKELLRLFGSEIRLKSIENMGSSFSFDIRFAISSSTTETPPAAVKSNPSKVSSSYAHILVVDDSEVNLFVAGNLLKRIGIQYDTASNGSEAIEKFKIHGYDLIFMDLKMPVMNGFEATATLRNIGVQIPIIALTASAFSDERDHALASGFTDYLIKPFSPQTFQNVLFTYLRTEEKSSIGIDTEGRG